MLHSFTQNINNLLGSYLEATSTSHTNFVKLVPLVLHTQHEQLLKDNCEE